MTLRHRVLAAASVTSALLVTTAACGNNDPEPLPPTRSSATPTPTVSPEQAAYDAALKRWTEYESTSEPFWAAGKHTTEATQLFKTYWERWPIPDKRLRQFAASDIQVKGTPKVLSSRAKSSTSGRVVIQQCVDYRTSTVTQHGKPAKREGVKPQLRFITLTKKGSTAPWLIYTLDDKTGRARACAA